jgi:uncharacterized lipoprotein YmbA
MTAHLPLRLVVITLTFSLLRLTGCVNLGGGTEQTTKFYVLNSLYSSNADIENERLKDDLSIGVGPVELPQYVNRPQIVTRTSRNELEVASFARWAEPLEQNYSRVLAENLSVLLSTDRVIVYPWKRTITIDYQVVVEVMRFDGALGGDVSMRARWSLLRDNGEKTLLRRHSNFRRGTEADNYEGLVSAQSQMLADLSSEIAEAIQSIARGSSSR